MGIITYLLFKSFKEGLLWVNESQDTAGKSLGALAEGYWGLILTGGSLILFIPILYRYLKIFRSNDTSKSLKSIKCGFFFLGLAIAPILAQLLKNQCAKMEVRRLVNKNLTANRYVQNEFYNYSDIYTTVNDTLNNWIQDSLGIVTAEILSNGNYELDSLITFNDRKTQFFATVHSSFPAGNNKYYTSSQSIIGFFLDKKWLIYPHWRQNKSYSIDTFPINKLKISHRSYYLNWQKEIKKIGDLASSGSSESRQTLFDSLPITDQIKTIDSLKQFIINKVEYDRNFGRYQETSRSTNFIHKRSAKKSKKLHKLLLEEMHIN